MLFCKTYMQSWICLLWGSEDDPVKVETCRPVYILFNAYEINCCVIDWHICVFYICQNTSGWQTLKKNQFSVSLFFVFMNLPSLSARNLADVTLNAPFSLTSTLHNSWDALFSRERFVPRSLTSLNSLKPGFRFSSTLSADTPLYLARNVQYFNILQRLLRVTIVTYVYRITYWCFLLLLYDFLI